MSIEKCIENFAPNIKWMVDNLGWPRKQAEAYTLITVVSSAARRRRARAVEAL